MNPSRQLSSILRLRNYLHQPSHFKIRTRITTINSVSTRTMSSNAPDPAHKQQPTQEQERQENALDAQTSTGAPLPLPEPSSGATQLNVNGSGVKLDHLGPLVVNKDGSLSRIANWDKMAEIEKQNTLRILGKRNQLRLDGLKGSGEGR
ncbi:hypothetical protein E8E11_005158 [Didymella keratinophila]|nr:hypothetical protein E8E11_005158 [Didymella keratinophila]